MNCRADPDGCVTKGLNDQDTVRLYFSLSFNLFTGLALLGFDTKTRT